MNTIDPTAIRCLLIDLDDTLYPANNGLWDLFKHRIEEYLVTHIGIPEDRVLAAHHRLYSQYGTTLRGLQQEYGVDTEHYLSFVHNAPLKDYLQPEPELLTMFTSLPQRKIIFTNAPGFHARQVLAAMNLTQVFEDIVDIHAIAPNCKPQPEAFHKALTLVSEAPERCLMVDDSPRNLETARALGITTVSIGPRRHPPSPHIPNIRHLKRIFSPSR